MQLLPIYMQFDEGIYEKNSSKIGWPHNEIKMSIVRNKETSFTFNTFSVGNVGISFLFDFSYELMSKWTSFVKYQNIRET